MGALLSAACEVTTFNRPPSARGRRAEEVEHRPGVLPEFFRDFSPRRAVERQDSGL